MRLYAGTLQAYEPRAQHRQQVQIYDENYRRLSVQRVISVEQRLSVTVTVQVLGGGLLVDCRCCEQVGGGEECVAVCVVGRRR